MTFRDASSPFLSMVTIHRHVKDHENERPQPAVEVSKNMYVDDLLTGALEDKSTLLLKEDWCRQLSKGGFEVKNRPQIPLTWLWKKRIPKKERRISVCPPRNQKRYLTL